MPNKFPAKFKKNQKFIFGPELCSNFVFYAKRPFQNAQELVKNVKSYEGLKIFTHFF
jgi:hypothetical protein